MAAICHGQFFTSISEPFVPSPQSLLILTEKLFILSSKVLVPIGANKRCLNVARVPAGNAGGPAHTPIGLSRNVPSPSVFPDGVTNTLNSLKVGF